MQTVTVLCRKGGTGKTTVALSLAIAAHRRGQKVILADVDPQHSSQYALSVRTQSGPAALATTGGKLFALKAASQNEGIDFFLVDTPSSLDASVLQAIHIADFCLLVTRPNYLDLAATVMTAATLKQLRKPALVVLNQAPPGRGDTETPIVRNAREALRFTNYPVAVTALGSRAIYASATSKGQSAEEAEPTGQASSEIAALWQEVIEAANIGEPSASLSAIGI